MSIFAKARNIVTGTASKSEKYTFRQGYAQPEPLCYGPDIGALKKWFCSKAWESQEGHAIPLAKEQIRVSYPSIGKINESLEYKLTIYAELITSLFKIDFVTVQLNYQSAFDGDENVIFKANTSATTRSDLLAYSIDPILFEHWLTHKSGCKKVLLGIEPSAHNAYGKGFSTPYQAT